ncbi:MAG: SH3 domain-containing protein [Spirochaetales bacterium]|nr:SH3 domain-containing protein [Spirochaetales bacterium]
MKINFKFKLQLFVLLTLIILTGCSEKPVGYGVLLWWNEDTSLTQGNIYPVYSESNIRDTYIITESGAPVVELPRWRMDLFNKEEEAQIFTDNYAPLLGIYGESLKNGQAVRKETSSTAERIYKLREEQIVKVVSKIEPKVTIGSTEDYWYRVLTEDGISGYCFGANLEIFDMEERLARKDTLKIDPLIADFLAKPFRPVEFREMVLEKRINLESFNPAIGTFPNLEEKTITVVTEEDTFVFEFDEILEGEPGRFLFGESGMDVKVINPNRLVVHYDNKGASVDQLYVVIDGMAGIIETEKQRQEALFQDLYYMGPAESSAYGTIAFEGINNFIWEDYGRLVPDIIPRGLDGRGSAEIIYYPASDIKEKYDGVITLNFTPPSSASTVNFFYNRLDAGLKLTHIPLKDIEEGIVERENPSPIIMYFSADSPRERVMEE